MILKMKRMGCLWLAFCCAGALNCSDALADAAKERREIFNQHFTLKEAEILTDKRFKEAVKYEAYSADFLTSAAKDTVQILGEIVVEEATQAGYEMLKEKLLDFLKCDEESRFNFKRTCEQLDRLRVQDVLVSPESLRNAFVEDLADILIEESVSKLKSKANLSPIFKQAMIAFKIPLTNSLPQQFSLADGTRPSKYEIVRIARGFLDTYYLTIRGEAAYEALFNHSNALDRDFVRDALIKALDRMITEVEKKKRSSITRNEIFEELKKVMLDYIQRDYAQFESIEVLLKQIVVRTIAGTLKDMESISSKVVVENLVNESLKAMEMVIRSDSFDSNEQKKVISLAVLAMARAMKQAKEEERRIESIDTLAKVERISDPDWSIEVKTAAKMLASKLQLALVTKEVRGVPPDPRKRLRHAIDAMFDIACLFATREISGCPDIARIDVTGSIEAIQYLGLLRVTTMAAFDKDNNTLMTAAIRGVDIALAAIGKEITRADIGETKQNDMINLKERLNNRKRALELLTSIFQYGVTYAAEKQGSVSQADAQAARKAVLKSLANEMTSRKHRAGETVISVGGSLRLFGGARIRRSGDYKEKDENGDQGEKYALHGPLSLPLGFGIDVYRKNKIEKDRDKAQGFHIELGILDLGEYVSFDENGNTIEDPDFQDAFSPSLTFAYFWTRKPLVYAGVTVGYSPSYNWNPDRDDKLGAWNVGLLFGVYVPFFDFN